MKFLPLLLLPYLLLPAPALADGPAPDVYSERAYLRELRRDYDRFQTSPRKRALEREERRLRAARAYGTPRASRPSTMRSAARRDYYERPLRRQELYGRPPIDSRPELVRYARPDRQEAATREEYRTYCMPMVTGHGVPRTFQRRAQESALKAWGRMVDSMYGRAYISAKRARNPRYVCDPVKTEWEGLVYECRFRATPCRAEF